MRDNGMAKKRKRATGDNIMIERFLKRARKLGLSYGQLQAMETCKMLSKKGFWEKEDLF